MCHKNKKNMKEFIFIINFTTDIIEFLHNNSCVLKPDGFARLSL